MFVCVCVYWNNPLKGEGKPVLFKSAVGSECMRRRAHSALSLSTTVLYAAGSSVVLITSFGFLYVMVVFPAMLGRLHEDGVGGDVLMRLYSFQELNKVSASWPIEWRSQDATD